MCPSFEMGGGFRVKTGGFQRRSEDGPGGGGAWNRMPSVADKGWSDMWCWRRLLRVPWTARRSSQSILKEISPGISLEGMMLKLKLQYFGHLMGRVDSLEKTLMLGGIVGRRRR